MEQFQNDEGVGGGLVLRVLRFSKIKFWSQSYLNAVVLPYLAVASLDFLPKLLSNDFQRIGEDNCLIILIWDIFSESLLGTDALKYRLQLLEVHMIVDLL